MRQIILAVMVALFAMVSFSCDEENKKAGPTPIGKYVGTILGRDSRHYIRVYEHEGNWIYQYHEFGIAVIPKRSEK